MSRAKFMALAKSHGIDVEYTGGRRSHPRTGEPVCWEMILDAPEGKTFTSSGCHMDCSIQAASENEVVPNWGDAIHELQGIIALGFGECDESECDVCDGL
jgi:hypothetical protein